MTQQTLVITQTQQLTMHADGIDTELVRDVPIRQTLNGDAAQGPPGPPGTLQVGTGDAFFSLDQQVALATWTVNHNLGKYPSVTVIDSTGDEVEGSILYDSVNSLRIVFTSAMTGKAYLN
jgi:hypothetical protein